MGWIVSAALYVLGVLVIMAARREYRSAAIRPKNMVVDRHLADCSDHGYGTGLSTRIAFQHYASENG